MVPPPLPHQLPGNRIDPNLNNGSGSASGLHSQHPNVLLDPPVPIPNYLHPSSISLPTPLPSNTSLPLNLGVSLPTTAPSTAPPSPRTAEWAQNQSTHPDPQIDKNLDGTGSFTRKGGSGSSYLGLSSGVTFLNAILKLCKERGGIFIDVENTMPGPGMGGGPGPIEGSGDGPKGTLPPKEEYMPFVDSYFEYFHGITPMVHEPTVRATLTGKIPFPKNDSYLALIYMIFAMGALDSVAQESDFHGQTYCDIARAILNNDIMESGSVELVQAIAILANYLQRNDKPNAGYLCLGAAVRMAIGIGLHVHDNHAKMSPLEAEMRKRVWWSIALLESGCSKTFGRPSGLCGVNLSQIPLPSNIDDEDLTSSSERLPPGVARETLYSTLIAHSKLARATTIVHTSILQLQPAPSLDQIKQYDRMILQVIGELPSYITYPTGPVRNNFSRHVLLWRLRDWRATLFRPILLAAAFDQIKEKHLNPAIVDAISICRSLAAENLSEMGEYIRVAQLRGSTRAEEWYCMYLSHQSSLTLLLSLVGEPAHVEAEAWRGTILATATWFRQLKAMKTVCYAPQVESAYQD
ncbi:fungal-specific transcription factor domain-containing protein [Filobasidium floriforme]|uniref:fungal-specific transcription factor domain-containing protein n=1 Tax=Filobasidium floriforme TaxID=5210 RepID=UPI001E8E7650|nr:fungal-specific transcription factor domain-containing protein [Filobasidium floriforme]KAH8090507.1 fungal-specific transcription factor domain-containing protein [Filobasidium floriforme]